MPDVPEPADESIPAVAAPDDAPLPGFRRAGRWRRLLAIVIDLLVLAAIGGLVMIPLWRILVGWGPYGRVFGFVLMPLYLGLLGSRIGGGQTVGKRLVGLRVIGVDGRLLSPARSWLRATLVSLPYLLNKWPLVPGPVVAFLMGLLIFGLGGSILYFMLANRRTGQAPHDLLTGTVVVPVGVGTEGMPRVWRGHWGIFLGVAAGIAALGTGVGYMLQSKLGTTMGDLQVAWLEMQRRPDVFSVAINHKTVYRTASAPAQILTLTVWTRGRLDDHQVLAREVALDALRLYPPARKVDAIHVVVTQAADVGVFSWRWSMRYGRPPALWESETGGPSGPP